MNRILLLLIIPMLILPSCSSNRNKYNGKKFIQVPLSDDAKTLDPANAFDTISLSVMPLALESLYQYSYFKRPMQLEPLLAESMPTVSRDKKTYTIRIKKGVYYTDDPAFPNGKGRELEAKDFIYQWMRLLHPKLQSNGPWIFEDKVVGYSERKKELLKHKGPSYEDLLLKPIKGFRILNKHTIQIKLTKPYSQLLYVLAMGFTVPVPQEVVLKYGHESLNDKMVGTGPYILKSFIRGSKIVMERNYNFRKEAFPSNPNNQEMNRKYAGKSVPFLDFIEFNIIKEDSPLWLQFQKGNLDYTGIPKDNFDKAITNGIDLSPEMKEKGIRLYTYDRSVIWYLNFNMKDKLLGSNVNLRRAIVRAIDRDYMIKVFLNGRGIKATSIVPPGIEGNTGRKKLIGDYNIKEAENYLKLAGYPGGANLRTINFDLRGSSTTARQRGEYIRSALEKIGIKVKVITNTFPSYLQKEKNGNLQFFFGGWAADYPDSENFLQLLYGGNVSPGPNASNWKDAQFDKLYLKAAQMKPSRRKNKLIRKAEGIAFNKAVWSMLYYPKAFTLYQKWIKNYIPNEFTNNQLKYVDVDMQEKKKIINEKF